ncbi:MAG: preprotein translocase subunit SecY [Lachnospiraceae bacterium]|nr:preprotein translocase subunit SecY [Lachnospiraceae bacterium]
MIKMFINAFKVKEIRKKLLFTFLCLVLVRLGSLIPAPGINNAAAREWLSVKFEGASGLINMLTGGSLTKMSIFALSISPYITSSIIMQLLTIAIPALAEMQKDGESGRKKIEKYSRYLTVLLAVIESSAMAIGFKNTYSGGQYLVQDGWLGVILVVVAFTAGSTFLMWLGERITENGIGNGISIILLINIVAEFPQEFSILFVNHVFSREKLVGKLFAGLLVVVLVLFVLVLIILLQDAERRIAVQYSKKMVGRKMMGGNSTFIPLKVNTAGVIPVIFAVSIFQFPLIIASFFGKSASRSGGLLGKFLYMCNTNNWFDFDGSNFAIKYTVGALLYIAMIIFFAYFYTSITFNPVEVAGNLKKSGGFIPGIRPGKPTIDYLTGVLNKIVFIGAIGLTIVALLPIICCGAFNVTSLGFGGTSLIIVVGVILETLKQVESMMLTRHYKGFLSE